MKIHRFFHSIPQHDIGALLLKERDLVSHIKRVLKLKQGEKIELFDGTGMTALCRIDSFAKDGVYVYIEQVSKESDLEKHIHLFCALLKKENFEIVVEKATELGAISITPLITTRTVKLGTNMTRLKKIATEAAEQSGRVTIPEIHEAVPLTTALKNAEGAIIICDPRGTHFKRIENAEISIFVGPEGGWSEDELLLAKSAGAKLMSFGTPILRGETAAIIATFIATL